MTRLRDEFKEQGKAALFEQLKVFLAGGTASRSYAEVAGELDMTEDAVKSAVYRLRGRYRHTIREQIAQTVTDETQIKQEIQELFAALGQ